MPTQEELNAAQVELDIANDNYAALADRYNKYQKLFQEYANASPEIQDRAAMAMGRALEDFYNIQDKMYAAEDRIQQAQNTVNSYNELLAQQPVQQPVVRSNYNSGRNIPRTPIVIEPEPKPLNNGPLEVINTDRAKPLVNNPVFNKLNEQQYLYNYRRPQVNSSPAIITNNEGIYGTLSPAPAVPFEVQAVQKMRGNDYLSGMKNLEKNYGYNVFNQRAYRDGKSWSLRS